MPLCVNIRPKVGGEKEKLEEKGQISVISITTALGVVMVLLVTYPWLEVYLDLEKKSVITFI